jgi:tetratricopeptide (TPR) repeat protein
VGFSAASAVLVAVLSGSAVAVVQAQKAARSAEREQIVRQFVADVFRINARVNPANAAMRPDSPVKLLEGGAQLIQQRFRGQPDMQAELFGVVGGVFSDMGAYKLAADYSVRKIEALNLMRADDTEQARALLALARTLMGVGHPVDAELRLRRALELARDDLPLRLDAMALLARLQLYQEHLKEAQATTQELESQVKAGVASPLVQAWTVFVRAGLLESQNHYEQALPMYRQAINQALGAEGPLSLAAVAMRFEFADSLVKQFNFKLARETYADADKALRQLGGAHEIRANYRSATVAYFLWGYSAMSATEATAQMQRGRASLTATALPVPEWFIPKIDMLLAAIQLESGNLSAGLPQFEASYEEFRKAIGQDDNSREWMQVLGTGLLSVGRHDEADRQFRESLEITQAAGLGLHPYTAWLYKIIALNLRYAGRWEEAEKFLDAAPQFEPLRGDGSTKDDRDKLLVWERAALQLDRGRVKQAVQMLLAHPPEGPDEDALSGYNGTLGEALCRDHQPAKGMALLKRVQQTYDVNGSHPNSPDYGNLWAIMGRCAFDAGDRTTAANYAARSRAVFAAQPDVAPYLKQPALQLDRLLGIRAAVRAG